MVKAIRVVGQRRAVCCENGRLERSSALGHPFHWISQDTDHIAFVMADKPSELGGDYYATNSVRLLAISAFDGTAGGDPGSFLKALWVVLLDSEEDSPSSVRVNRRGVAIVERRLWDESATWGGEGEITILE